MRNILQQLHDCIRLTNLVLYNVDLREVEENLDKLLESLVSNHEKGLSQKKLRIMIKVHRLSEEFVAKWNQGAVKESQVLTVTYDIMMNLILTLRIIRTNLSEKES